MQKKLNIKILPSQAADPANINREIAEQLGIEAEKITGYNLIKQSIDARCRQTWFQFTLTAFIDEPFQKIESIGPQLKDVHHAKKTVVIVGAGPAGLFAALRLIELGIKPIILKGGKNVRDRRRDLAAINKEGLMNPESNYCFGEGGAGTYSDGKLYTRSNKRG